jgi:hypothetical protein
VRDGQPVTLANRVVAPMVASGLLDATRKPNGSYKSVALSIGGANWLKFQLNKIT